MNDIVEMKSSKLATMSEDKLKGLLQKCLGLTVRNMSRAAQIVKVLDEKQADLSDINPTVLGYLRRIAMKQLLPELLLEWRETPVFKHARNLPIPLQKVVVGNQPITVAVLGKEDGYLVEPRNMGAHQAKQVFAYDHIRDKGAQLAWLREQQQTVEVDRPTPALPYQIKGKVVEFKQPCRMTVRDLRGLLKQLTN